MTRGLERAGWCLMLIAFVVMLPIAWLRAVQNRGGTDFPEYYAAGRYVLEHGRIDPDAITAYYLPSIDAVWAVLAIPPLGVSVVLWYLLGVLSYFGLLRAVREYLLEEAPEPQRSQALLAAGLLVLPLMLDLLCLGATNGFMLWWMVAGLGRAARGNWRSGGMLLGLAIWLKLLPGLAVPYLIVKRRFAAAATAMLTVLLVEVTLSVGVYGIEGTLAEYSHWWYQDAAGTVNQLLTNPASVGEQRVTNQSLPAVLRRTLTHLGYPAHSSRDLVVLAGLSPDQLRVVYYSAVAGLIGLIGWYCRRPGSRMPSTDQATEIALITLSTLWLTPIAPSYHPVAVLPAMALLLSRRFLQPAGWLVAAVWVAALTLHAVPHARAAGHMLWTTMFLGVLLVRCRPAAPSRQADANTPAGLTIDGLVRTFPVSSAAPG